MRRVVRAGACYSGSHLRSEAAVDPTGQGRAMDTVRLSVEGRDIEAPAASSILQACVHAGQTLVDGVGCMGQGVCGSCRVLVRRAGAREVKTALACETLVEDGMQVAF